MRDMHGPDDYCGPVATVPTSPDLNELRGFCVAADLGRPRPRRRAPARLEPSLSKRLASLEAQVGARLLDRSARGVALNAVGPAALPPRPTAPGRCRPGRRGDGGHEADGHRRAPGRQPLRQSRPSWRRCWTRLDASEKLAVELVTANSQVVRALVAEGRADVGVAASRPDPTPNPGVREAELVDDAIVCGVPPGHPWAARAQVTRKRFLATAMVVRDPSSNARWTVDAVLAVHDVKAADPLTEAATPRAAIAEARARRAPVLLSRHVLAQSDFTIVAVEGLVFPRSYVLVTPAYGEAGSEVRELVERIREHIRVWLR